MTDGAPIASGAAIVHNQRIMTDQCIDLNCDMGEGLDDADGAMLKIVSTANVASGAHAGSLERFAALIKQAAQRGVVCGIHPGFPDRENFGRTRLAMTPNEITEMIKAQIINCAAISTQTKTELPFVKVHGALANMAEEDAAIADAIAKAVAETGPERALVGMAGLGQSEAATRYGLRFVGEIFADRAYQDNGFLVPRTKSGSVLHDPAAITKRILAMLDDAAVITQSGNKLAAKIDTICVHGDTSEAVTIATALRTALERKGFTIASPFQAGQ